MSEQIIEQASTTIEDIDTKLIFADENFNCRGEIAPIDVVDLAKSIDSDGLIQPITVSPLLPPINGKTYRLLAGFRRYMAVALVLKKDKIRAVVNHKIVSEVQARILNLTENLARVELNILQEAKALQPLMLLGEGEKSICQKLNKSRAWVSMRVQLIKLPSAIQKEIAAGTIGQSHIRELYMIYRTGNEEGLHKAVRRLKDAKIRGIKNISVAPSIVDKHAAKVRGKYEIERMLNHLVDAGLVGLHTRALAWASGNRTLQDFMDDVVKHASEAGIPYNKPDHVALMTGELENPV